MMAHSILKAYNIDKAKRSLKQARNSKYFAHIRQNILHTCRTDEILPTLIRADIATADCDKRWYIFDGPVDVVWIENLNTVLDNNKKLSRHKGNNEIIADIDHDI